MPLFETPYYIFGQQIATTQVLQRITSRLLYNSQTPLVLLFTGLSGHGKTELARRMGSLLSLDLIVIDCTMLKGDTDIFGPWAPYQGWKNGSRLNNHLAENEAQSSSWTNSIRRQKTCARQCSCFSNRGLTPTAAIIKLSIAQKSSGYSLLISALGRYLCSGLPISKTVLQRCRKKPLSATCKLH